MLPQAPLPLRRVLGTQTKPGTLHPTFQKSLSPQVAGFCSAAGHSFALGNFSIMQKAGEESWRCRERTFFLPCLAGVSEPKACLKKYFVQATCNGLVKQAFIIASLHHATPSPRQMEKSFSLSFDVVILHSCEELTHSHFRTVTGSKAIKHKRPKRAALWTSSNPPMALLHPFLACNHLSPFSPMSTYRICSGERLHRSHGENGATRGQKLRRLFQIDTRVMEHRSVFSCGVFEICSAILYWEHLSLKDGQTPTATFYFLAAPQHNKPPSCLSPSALPLCLAPPSTPPVEGMELFWRHLNVTHWKSFSGSGLECNAQSPQQAQHEMGLSLPVSDWCHAGIALRFQTQNSAIMWAQPLSSVLSLKSLHIFPSRLALNIWWGKQ